MATDAANRKALADILSVLAMTMAEPGKRESLRYKLEGTRSELGDWGHEFVRNLAGEIGQEFQARIEKEASGGSLQTDNEDLMELVNVIVPFHLAHNAEAEAVDLLMEMGALRQLLDSSHIDATNYQRVCLYLLTSADFTDEPEDEEVHQSDFAMLSILNIIFRVFCALRLSCTGAKERSVFPMHFALPSVCAPGVATMMTRFSNQ